MSDTEENPYRHLRLDDIDRHTWVVGLLDGTSETVEAHMALRPNEEINAWKFYDKVETPEGISEKLVSWFPASRVTSIHRVMPDGTRKEVDQGD